MSDPLVPVITRAGMAALARADGTGLSAQIDRIAVGRGVNQAGTFVGYAPSKDMNGLYNEVAQVPVLSGERLAPAGFRVVAEVPKTSSPAEYMIREVGFLLSDGTLFAVWSSTQFPLAFKTALADVALSLDLYLEQIPTTLLTFAPRDPEIPAYLALHAETLAGVLYQWRDAMQVASRLAAARI